MRKSKRLLLVEGNDYTVLGSSAKPLGDRARLLNTSSNSSLISSSPSNSENGSATIDNTQIFRVHFSASIAILTVALIGVVCFAAIFSLYIRHLTVEEDRERRRGGENRRMRCRASQGLDRTVIETLPLFKYSLVKGLKQGKQALECVVCLSEFEDAETLRLLPECDHTFHLDCIDMWLFSHTTCPLCRTSVVPEQSGNPVPQQMEVNIEGQSQQMAEQTVIVVGEENGGFDDNGRGGNRGRNEMTGRRSPGQARDYYVQRSLMSLQNQTQYSMRSYSENLSLVGVGVNPLTPF